MAEIIYKLSADEKALVDAGRKAQKAFDDIAAGAERAGKKSKAAAKETKESFDNVDKSVGSVVANLGLSVSAAGLLAAAASEAAASFAELEKTQDRIAKKNATLASATMGQIGPGGELMSTVLRRGIEQATKTGPVGAEEMTNLIATLYQSNNELGVGALDYTETFKKLKGVADLPKLAEAIGTISDLMPELLPQDVADVALITAQNAGVGKIGEMSKTFKQLQAMGVSNAQALELSTRAAASDQGSKAVQSVIGAMTPSEQESLAAATSGRAPLTGDARLSAILASPQQYLGASAPKIMAALNEALPAGGDIYNQALTKDIVGRTMRAGQSDTQLQNDIAISATQAAKEGITDNRGPEAQAYVAEIRAQEKALMEMGAPEGGMFQRLARIIREFDMMTGGSVDPKFYRAGAPDFNPQNAAGMTESEYVKALKENTKSNQELAAIMSQSRVFGKVVPSIVYPPQ